MIQIPYKRRLLLEKRVDIKEELFLYLTEDLTVKLEIKNSPYKIFLFKGNKYMFEFNFSTYHIWCSHPNYWSLFEGNNTYANFNQIKEFTLKMINKHFKFSVNLLQEIATCYFQLNHNSRVN